jgi:hypothetical protein
MAKTEQTQWTFKAEDIFEKVPNDPKTVVMNIPEEISAEVGLNPGDPVKVLWGDQGTIIVEKIDEDEFKRKKMEQSNSSKRVD